MRCLAYCFTRFCTPFQALLHAVKIAALPPTFDAIKINSALVYLLLYVYWISDSESTKIYKRDWEDCSTGCFISGCMKTNAY